MCGRAVKKLRTDSLTFDGVALRPTRYTVITADWS